MKWIWLTSAALHVVGAIVLAPHLVSRMEADHQKHEELAEQVRQRQERLLELQRERREHIRLTEQQDRQLKEEARRRIAREMLQHVERLRRAREEILEARLLAFRQVERRDATEFLRREVEPIKKAIEQIPGELKALEKTLSEAGRPDLGPVEHGEQKREELQQELAEMIAEPVMFESNAREMAAIAQDWQKTLERHVHETDWQTQGNLRNKFDDLLKTATTINQLASAAEGADLVNSTQGAADNLELPPAAEPANLASASAQELYEAAAIIEQQVQDVNRDVRAAELAISANMSFPAALETIIARPIERPGFEQFVPESAPNPSVADLNAYREGLDRAARETDQMASSAESVTGQTQMLPGQQMTPAQRLAAESARATAVQNAGSRGFADLTGFAMGGGDFGNSNIGLKADTSGEGADMQRDNKLPPRFQLDQAMLKAKAMPGRMFTRESLRKGWLYLDTWYVIGPWENKSKIDYKNVHPPEYGIDFDAVYNNGKFADKPGHPYQQLRWEFLQADQMAVEPRQVFAASTYYAYTEVYFDEDRDMLLAVASDDAARLWLNNTVVWEDHGLSAWNMAEGFRKVRFRQGFNTILIRVENGPTHCVWSVLLCPDSAMK